MNKYNCIQDGKFIKDSCFGCEIDTNNCDIYDIKIKAQKYDAKMTPQKRLITNGKIEICGKCGKVLSKNIKKYCTYCGCRLE